MIIRRIFGGTSHYLVSLRNIAFNPIFGRSSEATINEIWLSGQRKLISLLQTVKKDLEFDTEDVISDVEDGSKKEDAALVHPQSNKIFIVHGHDDSMKNDVARVITTLGFEPVILHEQPDEGMTVIEKFEKYSMECAYAIVLLSPDDIGQQKDVDPSDGKYRARQNVILELGFFVGKIGRKRVLALLKNDSTGNLEVPSDLAGLVHTLYESSGGWKIKLGQGLKSCGYEVDFNRII